MIKKYIQNPINYFRLFLKKIHFFIQNPYFVFYELIELLRAITTSFITGSHKTKIIYRKLRGINFQFNFNYSHVFQVRTMFLGLIQTNVISVLLNYIKKGTTFIDVGASIGYMTAIGTGLVGKKGQVHSFEPSPDNFKKLSLIPLLNKQHQIYLNNYAIGENNYEKNMEVSHVHGFGWNTLVPDWIDSAKVKKIIKVKVRRLDEYLIERNLNDISLIKIDVEGYEFLVLKGLTKYFQKNLKSLPPILVEISPAANLKLGHNLKELEDFMKKFSYYAYDFANKSAVDIKKLTNWKDILFIQKKIDY